MIPILFDKDEVAFTSNGLGRLRDCISCVVTEERNGIYECDFEYPINGVNYDRIQLGRIIAVEHDESNDVQPFDIVSYSRPIDGIVTFHCVHISYRQTALTVYGSNINSLADAFTMLGTAQPSNPFTYWTDMNSQGFLASGDSVPHSVRQILGGMEGSILDSYGGEYEWDKWTVKLWAARGTLKNFTIRYGVNMTDYSDETDYSDTYTSVLPYWIGQDSNGNDIVVKGAMQSVSYPSFNNTGRCIPLDVTDKFDSNQGQPTTAQIEAEGMNYLNANQPYMPARTIKVDFIRLTDSPEYGNFKSLQTCKLCDSINIEFPRYNMTGQFKIVKTEYDVLQECYNTIELGALAASLSEALGINAEPTAKLKVMPTPVTPDDYVVEQGTSGIWTYIKWNSGRMECHGNYVANIAINKSSGAYGGYRSDAITATAFPTAFTANPTVLATAQGAGGWWVNNVAGSNTTNARFYLSCGASLSSASRSIAISAYGYWK